MITHSDAPSEEVLRKRLGRRPVPPAQYYKVKKNRIQRSCRRRRSFRQPETAGLMLDLRICGAASGIHRHAFDSRGWTSRAACRLHKQD
jgi:hypothetical protein